MTGSPMMRSSPTCQVARRPEFRQHVGNGPGMLENLCLEEAGHLLTWHSGGGFSKSKNLRGSHSLQDNYQFTSCVQYSNSHKNPLGLSTIQTD